MSTSALPWRKRSFELDSHIPNKKSCYYFRLESEGSAASTDGTESVYSVQERETDIVRDTTDTASDSTEYDVDIEYEVESLSDDDGREMIIFDSSGESEDIIYATAIVGDSSLETFITDAEDSDNSRQDDSSSGLRDFWICIQCKSQNDNPQYRFCDKCFQDRKAIFPPRPRRRKKAERTEEKSHSPVKLDALKSCLSGLSSQDSGISSGQELGSLCLDQIVVPTSAKSSSGSENRKRQISESSLSDDYEEKPPRKHAKKSDQEKKSDKESDSVRTKDDQIKGPLPELKEDCIMCNVKPKNSVFLHGRIAHMCCCYGCAMRTWKSLKRCPICQRKKMDKRATVVLWHFLYSVKAIKQFVQLKTEREFTRILLFCDFTQKSAPMSHFRPRISAPTASSSRIVSNNTHSKCNSRHSRDFSRVLLHTGLQHLFKSHRLFFFNEFLIYNRLKMSCPVPAPALKDLPRVAGDLKSELEGFKPTNLKNADTQEKIVLPSAEDVAQERTHNALIAGVENFKCSSLKRTNTKEKIVLPNAQDVAAEKTEKALIAGIEHFDTSKLKHTETQEKNPLPNKDIVEQEKTHQNLINGVEHFDKTTMKRTTTAEKIVLPDSEVIEQEKGQRQLISGIENFDSTKLRHAETCEKNPLPTKEIIDQEKSA